MRRALRRGRQSTVNSPKHLEIPTPANSRGVWLATWRPRRQFQSAASLPSLANAAIPSSVRPIVIHSGSAAPLTPLSDEVVLGSARVIPFEVPGLGNRTYIAVAGTDAVLIDPPRDVDSLLGFVRDGGWSVSHVFDTHVHNDYISGGLAAARLTDAEYVAPRDGGLTCPARRFSPSQALSSAPSRRFAAGFGGLPRRLRLLAADG